MRALLRPLLATPEFKSLYGGLERGYDQQIVFGLSGSSLSYTAGGLASACRCPVLVVTPGDAESIAMAEELSFLLPEMKVYPFPAYHLLPGHVLVRDQEVPAQRLRALDALREGKEKVVVASAEALLRRLSPPEMFFSARISLRTGETVDLGGLRRTLSEYGYECVDLVELKGQFSYRGGIIDIYPVTFDQPVRVEFFDEEVDSIRFFDPETQRSEKKVEEVSFGPASELIVSDEVRMRALEMLQAEQSGLLKEAARAKLSAAKAQQGELARSFADQLATGGFSQEWEQYLPYFYPQTYTLLDYFPPQSLVLFVDFLRTKEAVEAIQKERAEAFADLLAAGKILPGQFHAYAEWGKITASLARKRVVYFSLLPRQPKEISPKNTVAFSARRLQNFLTRLEMLANEVRRYKKSGYAVVFLVSTEERAQQLQNFLQDAGTDAFYASSLAGEAIRPGSAVISLGHLGNGFELISAKLVVFTESEIYGEVRAGRRERYRKAKRTAPLTDLKEGDYVVHVNHGIGRYQGVVSLSIGGISKDYLLIQYAGEDKLYVPTDQIGLIQKYLGAEGTAPKLSRLGGNEWSRVKSRVKEAVREMADELIALYAARQSLPGYAFAPDTVWQKEFEENFPYEETPDQLRAIAEVKADMERPRPMDRLLCGDVGYGKTEVALRAAFKAVVEGKQVAVLVPTTVLAQQHFNTFRERFAGFPVTIEMLSRFRSPREQRQIVNAIKEGKVDIVIGTHRLVQDDVVFKDLGLVVVDEEQRFGVAHKERLKQLRQDVDVLTLTATPIPRTLHMSLVGVRDTSLLETPPENRFPVQTYVLEEDPILIREAVRRELGRGGQVFFVYNRVQDLDRVAAWLRGLVPEARITIAHGQMKEDDLEQVMVDFVDGLYDILVCTTIIENGLDIPNVNTLIVKDAQNLGLAQLYQLRGRVGRSNRLAYAYFTFRRDQVLSELAEKRLAAIREFTEFGSGYKIAMRDLEIRGAGNLLGPEQHGHIAAVGFDLYCRLLSEAVQEAKGEPVRRQPETTVEVPVEAYIPEDYIPDPNQKVDIYRRLAAVRSEEEVADLEDELIDRFGDLPAPTRTLLAVAQVRALACQLGIKSIVGQEGGFRLQFFADHSLRGEVLVALSKKYYNRIKFGNAEDFEIRLKTRIPPDEPLNYLGFVKDFLTLLKEECAREKETEVGC
jgi:transcription-repair coupling factor (superfamily II helicase)